MNFLGPEGTYCLPRGPEDNRTNRATIRYGTYRRVMGLKKGRKKFPVSVQSRTDTLLARARL